MKNAVIYARYSSDRQNETSIEGQIEECRRYAIEHDLLVVQEYIDRAQTATTDRRPNFLRMIDDSENGTFEIILVYQFDRFSRNKDDSGYYKKILAKHGVRVVSAKEMISDDSAGIITEGMIETLNAWFSKQLSEKVTRGMYQRARLCKYNGGSMTLGYTANEEGYYVPDEVTAPIVKEIFERIFEGQTAKSIIDDLNERGIKTTRGNTFGKSSLQKMLRNERYKGIYIYGDIRIPDGMPRLVSDQLFDDVQEVLGDKAHHGHRPAIEDYILTGKLYCGHCRDLMKGTSGTSKTGKTHRYYTCSNAPKICDKKNVRKEELEPIVLETCRDLLTDEVIDSVVAAVEEQNKVDQESPSIIRLKGDIKDTEKKIEKLLDQIEEGTGSARVSQRLKKREDELDILKKELKKEKARQLKLDPALVRSFLLSLRNYSRDDLTYQKMLIKAFVDRIYLYDDHFTILLNHSGKKGKATKNEVREVERYFDQSSSTTAEYGVPITNGWAPPIRFVIHSQSAGSRTRTGVGVKRGSPVDFRGLC